MNSHFNFAESESRKRSDGAKNKIVKDCISIDKPSVDRAGVRWTRYEEAILSLEIKKGYTLDTITQAHHRKVGGIKSRIIMHMLDWVKLERVTPEQLCKILKPSDLKKHDYNPIEA